MNRKPNLLAAFLAVMLCVCMFCDCSGSTGDKVERFAAAAPSDSGSIDIPGYHNRGHFFAKLSGIPDKKLL